MLLRWFVLKWVMWNNQFYLIHISFQILTDEAPFASYRLGLGWQIINIIREEERPQPTPKIQGLISRNMWKIMQACWATKPESRLSAEDIVQRIPWFIPPFVGSNLRPLVIPWAFVHSIGLVATRRMVSELKVFCFMPQDSVSDRQVLLESFSNAIYQYLEGESCAGVKLERNWVLLAIWQYIYDLVEGTTIMSSGKVLSSRVYVMWRMTFNLAWTSRFSDKVDYSHQSVLGAL